MRLFFALNLSNQDKLKIHHWMGKTLPPFERPVSITNYHITLAFLGQAEHHQLESIAAIADNLVANQTLTRDSLRSNKLKLTLDQCGVWPKPKIYWVGPSQIPEGLTAFSNKLGRAAQRLGFQIDKRAYQPHVTLARKVSPPAPYPLIEPNLDIEVTDFSLFESVSGKQGVQYIPLETWKIPSFK